MFEHSEEYEWYVAFEEVFKELNTKQLASTRTVADEKILLFSIKLIGYFVCRGCGKRWNSMNSQVKFSYMIVPKHSRGELRICKQFGEKCRFCIEFNPFVQFSIPRIDNDHKLYAMECLYRLVNLKFYGVNLERPTAEFKGSGVHFEAGCEACAFGGVVPIHFFAAFL